MSIHSSTNKMFKLLPLLALLAAANNATAGVVMPPLPPAQVATSATSAPVPTAQAAMPMLLSAKPAVASTSPVATTLDRPITIMPVTSVVKPVVVEQKPKKHVVKAKRTVLVKVVDAAPAKGKPDPYANITITAVSNSELNRFVFASPVKQALFPADVPASKPLYVAGNKEVLISFGPGMPDVAQMIVELTNGKVATFYLHSQKGPGAIVRYEGARAGRAADASTASPSLGTSGSPGTQAVSLLAAVVRGEIPGGYEAVATPATVAFDKFTVVPVSAWSDQGSTTIYAFQLIAAKGQSAAVSAPEFFKPGVLAVDVEGDTVDDAHSPMVYIVETANGGE
jgi:hypothetical protein